MNILQKILETKQQEVSLLKKNYCIEDFTGLDFHSKPTINIIDRIKDNPDLSIIAEIKKASPSKGIIKENFDAVNIAKVYMESDLDAISILTDETYFNGSIKFLNDIAKIKTKPLLRKDFIIDEIQIFEARANGADLILLIAEALSAEKIIQLTKTAQSIGLEVLLEFHSEDQIKKIDFSLNRLIGINNRNLVTFETDISTTINLKKSLPDDIMLVSESGIHTKNDVELLKQNGANAVLVGEFLMRGNDMTENIHQLIKWCKSEN